MSGTTLELTTEKIIKQYAIETLPLIKRFFRSLWERYKGFPSFALSDRYKVLAWDMFAL